MAADGVKDAAADDAWQSGVGAEESLRQAAAVLHGAAEADDGDGGNGNDATKLHPDRSVMVQVVHEVIDPHQGELKRQLQVQLSPEFYG